MSLADRTPPDSPFAVLYTKRQDAPAKKSKAMPARDKLQRAANRKNPYSDAAKKYSVDKTRAIERGGI